MTRLAAVLAMAAFLLLAPRAAAAQAAAGSLDELMQSGAVRPGDTLYVTGVDGRETRGTLAAVTSTSLAIDTGLLADRRQTLPASEIRRITRADPLRNGMLIGLGAGVAVAALAPAMVCDLPDPECAPRAFLGVGLPSMAGGAALGALIDRAIRRTVYRHDPSRASLRVLPIGLPGARGLAVRLGF